VSRVGASVSDEGVEVVLLGVLVEHERVARARAVVPGLGFRVGFGPVGCQ